MQQLRVLFVDDSDLDVMLAVRALRAAGYEVSYVRVERAEDFDRELQSAAWDVVICDHKMPEFDALTALRQHARLASEIPFVIVSGAMPDELAIDAMREGARDFLNKNNLSRLVPAIERELRGARDRHLLRQTQASMDRLLYSDLLTGVGNQDGLFQRLGEAFGKQQRIALVLVDLDRFRRVTQSLGMVAANRILRVTAMRLGAVVEVQQGFVARLGSDRFGLVIPYAGERAGLDALGAQIHDALQPPVAFDGHGFMVSAGVGVAIAPDHALQVERLLQVAESALEQAKRAGGRGVVVYEAGMGTQTRNQLILEHALFRAAERREFVLHYQPLVELANGRPVGIEALLRWQCPQRGMVLPGDFVPQLEDSGLIVEVGQWVIGEALSQLKRWRESGLTRGLTGFRLSINLSAAQFRQVDFVPTVQRLLTESGVPAAMVELEITESVAMGNEEQTIATLTALKALGVSVAIDDFGTGYSSLAYLQHFPVDRLKIDQSFVRGEAAGGNDGIVKAVLAIGRSMNLAITAEGVETVAQAERLIASGCLEAQGFHFARPMPADEMTAYLRRWA